MFYSYCSGVFGRYYPIIMQDNNCLLTLSTTDVATSCIKFHMPTYSHPMYTVKASKKYFFFFKSKKHLLLQFQGKKKIKYA